jgi:hypothetical protein
MRQLIKGNFIQRIQQKTRNTMTNHLTETTHFFYLEADGAYDLVRAFLGSKHTIVWKLPDFTMPSIIQSNFFKEEQKTIHTIVRNLISQHMLLH